ncbi:MAG: FAD-dependent oxidoreductase, partial [Chloroflexi bacterium]|nr:FAD-dependent oxidoreductase [Chloroflexota bacterium]
SRLKKLEKMFSPLRIGSLELKNRIAMAPMATNFANPDGTISEQLSAYFEARARGGVGLIILEVTTIDRDFPYVPHSVGLWDDSLIPSMRKFTDLMHSYGTKVFPQVSHPGPESVSFLKGIQPVGPCVVISHSNKVICRELSVEEIERIVEQYGDAARRAREAGCDGLELHAAHDYMLLGSFLSALRNHRTDEYGGNLDDRLKLPLDVVKKIKAKAGSDFPIIVRLSGDEYTLGGRDIRGTQYVTRVLAEAGVDAFEISGGVYPQSSWRILAPTGTMLGLNVANAAKVKEVVDVPVAAVCRINNPRFAEDILQRNEADLIVMGRALLADPEFPNKAAEGRLEDIAPCMGCGLGCVAGRQGGNPMTCVINPSIGREREMAITPADKAKKVMVVGAGPAGLEAARVAAIRGHQVTLYEKEAVPGGQFNLAYVPPLKQELSLGTKYLRKQVEKAGVEVKLNTEVTPELVEEVKPDVVVVATGGEPLVINLPGIKGKSVALGHDVLAGKVFIKRGKVLVIGGGMVGLEVADYLADLGDNPIVGRMEVTVVEMLDKVGMDMAPEGRTLLMERLRQREAKILTSTTVKEILEDGVVAVRDGEEVAIRGMDLVIVAMGAKSVDVLSDKIRDKVAEVYVIGDAKQPRKAVEAIAEGAEVGRQI